MSSPQGLEDLMDKSCSCTSTRGAVRMKAKRLTRREFDWPDFHIPFADAFGAGAVLLRH